MCLMGCESKQVVLNKYDKIPSYLLEAPLIADQNDAGVLLIDVYGGYKSCVEQLDAIKEYERNRDGQK